MSKKSPQLRFEGFTDDWEVRKLNEVSDIYDGTHQTPKYQDNGVMFLSVENIKTLTSNKFISREAFEDEFKIRPQRGDVLMTRIGDIGTANVVETDEDLAYYVSLALFKSEELNPYFLQASIYAPFVQDQIWKRTLHIAFPKKINKNEIGQVPINVPKLAEQTKIGSFFKQLDKTIALHQRKLDLLKEQKKGYLQKMFPKNGAKVPELRFAGFVDDWEQRKLGEMLVNLEAGVSVNSSDYDTGYFILKTSAIKMGNIDLLEVKSIVSEEVARAKTPLIKNSIIISRMNTPELVGASGLVRESIDNIFLPDRLWQGQVAGNFSPEWLIQSINIAANIKKIRDLATGTSGSMKNISKKSMLDLIINVPTLEEQQKIGSFFKQLDDVIALHQRKLDLLKEQKKGFLQKMFV
ncbi:restriction endonuclease subunit S [Lactococcus cremoris]|uniref:restriction endonuclease subunit S n=1 Tax=Lactococcus TaxID=1357 RepID=UPI0033664EB3